MKRLDHVAAVMTLAMHHDYRQGHAVDLSGFGNHGAIVGAPFSVEGNETGLMLDGQVSRVVVRPSPALGAMGGLRVTVQARLDELTERSNLVEGFLSFALLVHGDRAIQGSVYDGETWITARSAPGAVTEGRGFECTYSCRSRFGSHLYLDGALVGWDRRAPVAINPVSWPFGLNIGGWPDADAFMFKGRLSVVRLWREQQFDD